MAVTASSLIFEAILFSCHGNGTLLMNVHLHGVQLCGSALTQSIWRPHAQPVFFPGVRSRRETAWCQEQLFIPSIRKYRICFGHVYVSLCFIACGRVAKYALPRDAWVGFTPFSLEHFGTSASVLSVSAHTPTNWSISAVCNRDLHGVREKAGRVASHAESFYLWCYGDVAAYGGAKLRPLSLCNF